MKVKTLFIIMFIAVSFYAYGEENLDGVVNVMVSSLKVDNSRCITVPGERGVLRIYLENKNLNANSVDYVVIDYDNRRVAFHAGNNFLITRDDKLVYGKYKTKIYAKSDKYPHDEELKIKHNSFMYNYTDKGIKINADNNDFTANELIYDKAKSKFLIYRNNSVVKQINLGI